MPRQLPQIEIAGNTFVVDIRSDHIAAVRPPSGFAPIRFSEMDGPEARRRFLLDTRTLSRYVPSPNMKKLPAHVLCVEIDHKALLDPHGFCKLHGVPETVIPKELLAMKDGQPQVAVLERVKLAGHEYFIDKFGLAFLDTLNQHNKLYFHYFKTNKEEGLSLLYNTDTRAIAGKSPTENRAAWKTIDMPPAEKVSPNFEEAARKKKMVAHFINQVAGTAAMQQVAAKKRKRSNAFVNYVRKNGKRR